MLPAVAMAAALAVAGTPALAKVAGEASLARMLDGRVAGQPVDCIPLSVHGGSNLTVVDGVGIVYRIGDTIYVNRTANPRILDWDDVLVLEPATGSQLCRHDQVYTHDRSGLARTGVVFLEQFVPYKRAG